MDTLPLHDVIIVGAGAAGLCTAIAARRAAPGADVLLLDGARRPGAKILVSGGGRCNVTNRRVTEQDFHGGSRAAVRQVLRAFTVPETLAFFAELGVTLHEEERGKLFPDSHRSRDVLEALLHECARLGVARLDGCRVLDISRTGDGFLIDTGRGPLRAQRVVLATGGQSLPKSGSDGAGYRFARALGHSIVAPVPALVPLVLDTARSLDHAAVAGVSHDAEFGVWLDGRLVERVTGPLLWTHVGLSGPAALDVSRHYTRATADGHPVHLTLAFCPGERFETMDARVLDLVADRPRASVATLVAALVPTSVAEAVARWAGVDPARATRDLSREDRRRLVRALVEWPVPVTGTRGYTHAEVTAGGVPLAEINPRTMASRVCEGLFLVGEVIDVDGRLGGFNFQWAWSSAVVAGRALGACRSSA